MDDDLFPVLTYRAWGQTVDERERFQIVLDEMAWWLRIRLDALDKAVNRLIEVQHVVTSDLERWR